ncbi:AhpC-TSA-domain-containing protein, partial [Cristinia sonorae]
SPHISTMADTTSGSRRSTRIAAQPKKDELAAPAPAKKAPVTKKRSGGGSAEEPKEEHAPAAKKVCMHFWSLFEGSDGEAERAPALDPIDIGDVLPSVTLKTEKDEDIDVASLTAEKGVVLFLVPKADTPGCTNQACGFRDIYPDFTSSGFDVYCLSADSPAAQSKWQTKKELPYPLLSDPKRVLIRALGAATGGKTNRSHFIFEKGGKLVDKKNPVKPADSPKLALEFVKSLGST